MSYDRSLERSARTPPPTLLFLSSLVKEQKSSSDDEEENLAHPIRLPRQDQEASVRQIPKVPAVDEAYLNQPRSKVITYFEVFSEICAARIFVQHSRKLHRSQKRIRLCVYVFQIILSDPETFPMSSEEPWRFAVCWQPRLVPSMKPSKVFIGTAHMAEPLRTLSAAV